MNKMSNKNTFDVIIIGGGPGGYIAAIRAAQLGKKVAVVEKNALGGICLNWGCIPTKALLRSAEILHLVKNAGQFGIQISDHSVDFKAVIKRSRSIARRFSKGIEYLLKKNNITHIHGRGVLKSPVEIEVMGNDGDVTTYSTKNVIIATGARNKNIPNLAPDGDRIISFREAMVLEEIPTSMIIVGAGAIGVEFASLYREFGTEIHLVEMLPIILPVEDEEISTLLENSFKKRGIRVYTSTTVNRIESAEDRVEIRLISGDKTEVLSGDTVLMAVGFQGNIENIGLAKVGIQVKDGWIKTNQFYETSVKGIYSIGDVIGPPWLAHVASAEGKVAAEHISDKKPQPIDYNNVPSCTYCRPQVASVGLTEKQALDKGFDIKVGRFPFRADGKAVSMGDSEGFVKIIFDARRRTILGCHIIGPEATELIMEVVTARSSETTVDEFLRIIHAHPTLSEAIFEAAEDAFGKAIHI